MEGNLLLIVVGVLAGWAISAGLMVRDRKLGLAAAGLMGLLVSLYLGMQHIDTGSPSVCNINATFDCDRVNRSQYSELAGIPIALLGAGFYAAVLAVAVLAFTKAERYARVGNLLFIGGVISVGYSLFLAWASVQLGAWCLLCISLYGVNLLIVGGSWGLRHADGELAALKDPQDRSLGAMITAGLVVFVGSMLVYNSQSGGTAAQVQQAVQASGDGAAYGQLMEQALAPVALRGDEAVLGDPAAPYTVIEFADFQCPACASVTPLMHELVARNPQVKVLFKHYPLSNICNPNIGREFHVDSCRAAYAAECARQQGRFWDLTHLMMKNQSELDLAGISFMAEQVGLDAPTLAACMESPATHELIRQDVLSGQAAGVEGTPALFLQGTHGAEWVNLTAGPEGGELLIRAHLAGKPLPPPGPPRSHEGHGH
jgi:protein-disulfide isomerase/uncharacterized membrane protein